MFQKGDGIWKWTTISQTILECDVKDLQNLHTKLIAAAMSTNKMIQLNLKNIEFLSHNVHTLLN